MSNNWLPSSAEDDQQKAQRRRLLKDKSPGVREVVAKLDALRSAPPDEVPEVSPVVNTQPRQQRTDPKSISERPDPKVIGEGYQPKAISEVPPVFTQQTHPATNQETPYDARLIEIARLWSKLNERDREELLLTAKMKVHLNNKGG